MLKEVEPKEALHDAVDGRHVYQLYTMRFEDTDDEELFTEDISELIKRVMNRSRSRFLVDDEEPKAKPKKQPMSRGKIIDTGKIKALHDAGWTNNAIADEMKISAPTVAKYVALEEDGGKK